MNPPVGQRSSRRRKAIFAVIRDAEGPLTVDEIHGRARKKIPRLGIATVYRAVKLFLEGGRIRNVLLPDGETRYEASGREHHFHFRCEQCVRVFCLPSCPLERVAGRILPRGFQASKHALTIFGTCPECAARRAGPA